MNKRMFVAGYTYGAWKKAPVELLIIAYSWEEAVLDAIRVTPDTYRLMQITEDQREIGQETPDA